MQLGLQEHLVSRRGFAAAAPGQRPPPRRRNRLGGDDDPARLAGRCLYLDATDRRIVQALWAEGHSVRTVAELTGASPVRVRRRFRRAWRRLHSPAFVAAVRCLRLLTPEQARVAAAHHLQGLSARAAARALGLSPHRVRKLLLEINAIVRAAEALPTAG